MNKCKLPERGRTRRSLVADYPVCWRSSGLVWTSAGEMGRPRVDGGQGGPTQHAWDGDGYLISAVDPGCKRDRYNGAE